MKTNKETGPDGISIEMIQCLDELGVDIMTKLINKIYDTGELPEDLTKSIFIALPKTPGATECELHRTISLMSHGTKILLKILMMRMKSKTRPEIAKEQYGFMPDKSTRNAIFILRMIIERSIEVKHDIYLCFLDYTKAFDKVKHDNLFQILEQLDIDGKDLRLIRNLYWNQKAAMKVNNDTSPRTVGCCSHIAAAIWFLGYERYQSTTNRQPSSTNATNIQNADDISDFEPSSNDEDNSYIYISK
ncbi:unnamed protein product [Rotaria magnacalcarata]|nr:unnamed protein product [Rotaria magnacalcarata]